MDTGDGDTHGDINTFWRERDYNLNATKGYLTGGATPTPLPANQFTTTLSGAEETPAVAEALLRAAETATTP